MTTATTGTQAKILERVSAAEEQLQQLIHGVRLLEGGGELNLVLPELHDKATGRIDARKLAAYMGVPLKRLADGLGLNYKAIHQNPSAGSSQAALKPVKRGMEILHQFFRTPATVRAWLNTAHPDLEGHTALEMILAGNPKAVLRILENAVAGVPV
jgi:hypothetical protein